MKIGTQVLDLDKLADEVLAKSVKTTDKEDAPADNEKVNPEEISANIPDNSNEKPDETTAEEKENREEPVEKSVGAAENSEGEEPMEKSETGNESPETAEKPAEGSENSEGEEPIEKSFKSNDDIKKSIEASEFLEAVVECIVKSLTETQTTIQKSQSASEDAYEVFAKSLAANLRQGEAVQEQISTAMDDIKKSLSEEISSMKSEILGQLEEFSHQPAHMRKSMQNVNVHDKNFQKSLGQPAAGQQLSKSEVLATLTSEMYSGNPLVTANDIISYESGAPLRPEVERLVISKHQ